MLETTRQPFAGFFEEALASTWVRDDLSFSRAPRPDVLGTARLPSYEAKPGLRNVCVECLRDRSACVCD